MKRLAVFGSTGSIGRQTLDVARNFPDWFKVIGLAAGGNLELLEQQVAEFRPELVYSTALERKSPRRTRSSQIQSRFAPMEEIAAHPDVDIVVVATSGKAGLSPCFAALRAGKPVALANKEVLVMAGDLATAEAKHTGASIMPVDSEHSAIWQCLRGEQAEIERLILTASGGPFRGLPAVELAKVTAAEALRHPTWIMGRKVTIDSATLMNKGLEVIEAHWLFSVPYANIQVVIHPESMIHSMIEFVDGSVKAQLSYPDMHLPIQHALSYPDRLPAQYVPRLDFARTARLSFETPDTGRFPCLALAIEAGKKGGTYPAALCAADEVAVGAFLEGRIGFTGIPLLVEAVLGRHSGIKHPSLQEIMEADARAREDAASIIGAEKL